MTRRLQPVAEQLRWAHAPVQVGKEDEWNAFRRVIPAGNIPLEIRKTTASVGRADREPPKVREHPKQDRLAELVLSREIDWNQVHSKRSSCSKVVGVVLGSAASATLIPPARRSRTSRTEDAISATVPSLSGLSITTSSPPMPFCERRSPLCVLTKIWRRRFLCSR